MQVRKPDPTITEEEIKKWREEEEKELHESFAPFSEWIARGAMSHTQAFPDMKEVPRPISKACREIMKIARHENKIPTECIDKGCEAAGVEVSDLMEELDNLKTSVSNTRIHFKGRGKKGADSNRPVCPHCGKDLKRSYEATKQDSGKWVKIPYGWHCKKDKYQIFD